LLKDRNQIKSQIFFQDSIVGDIQLNKNLCYEIYDFLFCCSDITSDAIALSMEANFKEATRNLIGLAKQMDPEREVVKALNLLPKKEDEKPGLDNLRDYLVIKEFIERDIQTLLLDKRMLADPEMANKVDPLDVLLLAANLLPNQTSELIVSYSRCYYEAKEHYRKLGSAPGAYLFTSQITLH
jgi:hypothetical protein